MQFDEMIVTARQIAGFIAVQNCSMFGRRYSLRTQRTAGVGLVPKNFSSFSKS